MNFSNLAIFIHTFLRDDLMRRCVASVNKHLPGARIYLSDGGRMTEHKRGFYEGMREAGHWVKHYDEFNIWWRKVFNQKVEIAQERFILKLDDDFVVTDDTRVERMIQLMELEPSLGLLGGQVWHEHRNEASPYVYQVYSEVECKYLLRFAPQREVGFTHCDFVPDFWIARREIFKDIQMDPNLGPAQGGHEKFFTEIYEKRMRGEIDWRVGYTKECTILHEKSSQSAEYKKHRASGMSKYERNTKVIKP